MSEMVRHKGIIKRLSTKENTREVYDKLVESGEIDDRWAEFKEDGTPLYFDSDKYDVINGCIFDVSGAPQEYDADEEVADATRLNDTDYQVHIYYYNGGDSPIYEAIAEADKVYERTKNTESTEKELDVIIEDLITGHNFDYARKAILEWHNKHKS